MLTRVYYIRRKHLNLLRHFLFDFFRISLLHCCASLRFVVFLPCLLKWVSFATSQYWITLRLTFFFKKRWVGNIFFCNISFKQRKKWTLENFWKFNILQLNMKFYKILIDTICIVHAGVREYIVSQVTALRQWRI